MTKKKFELLPNEFIKKGDKIFYRIKALKSFGDVNVGDIGGYVENEYNLSHSGNCWIYDNAKVSGAAYVQDNAKVCGSADVFGNAKINHYAIVAGKAMVFDYAVITDYAIVTDKAKVCDASRVSDDSRIHGDVVLMGAQTFKNADVSSIFDYMVIDNVGERLNTITFYRTKDGSIGYGCGGNSGTLEELKEQYKDTEFAEEYECMIKLAEARFKRMKK